MLTEQRYEKILDLVNEKKSVTVKEMTELLESSESTIRRDLTVLHKKGRLVKVFGGAVAIDMEYRTKDEEVDRREDENKEAKEQIARFAASLIRADDFVFLDAGTTTAWIPDFLIEKSAVFVTNGIAHAKKLARLGVEVHLLGGEYKSSTEAIVGDEAVEQLRRYHFTKGFFGTNGIGKTAGYTTPDIREASLKRCAAQQSRETYILGDSKKFNRMSAVSFCDFYDATVITEEILPEFARCSNILKAE